MIKKSTSHEYLWPGTKLAWSILLSGIGIIVGLFGLGAIGISAMKAFQLAKKSDQSASFWMVMTAISFLPGSLAMLILRKMKHFKVGATNEDTSMLSAVLILLLLVFFSYFAMDLLLIRFAGSR